MDLEESVNWKKEQDVKQWAAEAANDVDAVQMSDEKQKVGP